MANTPFPQTSLTPSMLRVLIAGMNDLYDGDLVQRAHADSVTRDVFRETGWVVTRSGACRGSEVNEGYVREGVGASQRYNGEWTDDEGQPVEDGTRLYLDSACTIFVRNTENG